MTLSSKVDKLKNLKFQKGLLEVLETVFESS